jgi:hypothetical protein
VITCQRRSQQLNINQKETQDSLKTFISNYGSQLAWSKEKAIA